MDKPSLSHHRRKLNEPLNHHFSFLRSLLKIPTYHQYENIDTHIAPSCFWTKMTSTPHVSPTYFFKTNPTYYQAQEIITIING